MGSGLRARVALLCTLVMECFLQLQWTLTLERMHVPYQWTIATDYIVLYVSRLLANPMTSKDIQSLPIEEQQGVQHGSTVAIGELVIHKYAAVEVVS